MYGKLSKPARANGGMRVCKLVNELRNAFVRVCVCVRVCVRVCDFHL